MGTLQAIIIDLSYSMFAEFISETKELQFEQFDRLYIQWQTKERQFNGEQLVDILQISLFLVVLNHMKPKS